MKKHLGITVLACLTLGLAPFAPEPHIWKQILNLWYGRPMPAMDWFDLLMHGAPWIYLIIILFSLLRKKPA
ncbi:MAG: hypothetical protein ACI837_002038 [Crocinitomicaceae bacterium]|jgi:hypothetical protein